MGFTDGGWIGGVWEDCEDAVDCIFDEWTNWDASTCEGANGQWGCCRGEQVGDRGGCPHGNKKTTVFFKMCEDVVSIFGRFSPGYGEGKECFFLHIFVEFTVFSLVPFLSIHPPRRLGDSGDRIMIPWNHQLLNMSLSRIRFLTTLGREVCWCKPNEDFGHLSWASTLHPKEFQPKRLGFKDPIFLCEDLNFLGAVQGIELFDLYNLYHFFFVNPMSHSWNLVLVLFLLFGTHTNCVMFYFQRWYLYL